MSLQAYIPQLSNQRGFSTNQPFTPIQRIDPQPYIFEPIAHPLIDNRQRVQLLGPNDPLQYDTFHPKSIYGSRRDIHDTWFLNSTLRSEYQSLEYIFNQQTLRRTVSYDEIQHPNHLLQQYAPINLIPMQKCRQLPCRTWISTGSCPYGDRCVFLHDPRVVSKLPQQCGKARKKSQEDLCQDSIFWPTMPREIVSAKLDSRNLPHISQYYVVPAPSAALDLDSIMLGPHTNLWDEPVRDIRHARAAYSMWEHFLDFCAVDLNSVVKEPRNVPMHCNDPMCVINPYTGRRRLNVFIELSQIKNTVGDSASELM